MRNRSATVKSFWAMALLLVGSGNLLAQVGGPGTVVVPGGGSGLPGADQVTESMLKVVNACTDEYVLTCETTTGDFEWQAGGGSPFTNGIEAYRSNHANNAAGVSIGDSAGLVDVTDSINIGFFAGGCSAAGGTTDPSGNQNIRIGRHAGCASVGDNAVMIGHAAGQNAKGGNSGSVIIGYQAARNAAAATPFYTFLGTIIGNEAFAAGLSAQRATAVGAYAGNGCTAGTGAVLLGYEAGRSATNCTSSILIGDGAGKSLSRNRTLVIDSDETYAPTGTGALIYGELDNRTLQLNAGTGFRYRMESVTTTKTPALIESGEFYYTGDADGQAITLLDDPTVLGTFWNFIVTVTQSSNSLSIAPGSGETLRDGASTCSTITATAIGARLGVMVTGTGSGGHFTVIEKLGTWTCNA